MKHLLPFIILTLVSFSATAQHKPRPDAFTPAEERHLTKSTHMATTTEEMASWNRYPTYETYCEMMQQWSILYPDLCSIDTIGTSINGRLILAAHIASYNDTSVTSRPQFFYSSTIHGDEVTGYVMMLRLIDTLLTSYGNNLRLTDLVNTTDIYINPLANPDGTYWRGNNTVLGSQRYNADGIDLNRTFPDPFSTPAKNIPQENQAMIDYVTAHNFRLSANLHGGAEVLNYPWDSFQSSVLSHPQNEWWLTICRELADTLHTYSRSHFRDITDSGFINGGDWYVIDGGRQDYINYYHNCLEMTMEISSFKTPDSDQLPEYWRFLSPMLIRYIEMVHQLPESLTAIENAPRSALHTPLAYPNPTSECVSVSGLQPGVTATLHDFTGRIIQTVKQSGNQAITIDLRNLPQGIYLLRSNGQFTRIIKL